MKYVVKIDFRDGDYVYDTKEAVFDFPRLEGTEKQIKYAAALRYAVIQDWYKKIFAFCQKRGLKPEDKILESHAKRGLNLATTSAKELIEELEFKKYLLYKQI